MVVWGKTFKAIGLMVCLVGVTKNCKWAFIKLAIYELQLLKWFFTIPSVLIRFENPSNLSFFNKRVLSGKNFIAIASVVYPVGMTEIDNNVANNL